MRAPHRLLVTVSRSWPDPDILWDACDKARARLQEGATLLEVRPMTLVHGACGLVYDRGHWQLPSRGRYVSDAVAHAWALDTPGVTPEPHPARWSECGPRCRPGHQRPRRDGSTYCPTAGHRRNAEMVAAGADEMLAFIHRQSPGATGCAALAEKAGIPVLYYRAG